MNYICKGQIANKLTLEQFHQEYIYIEKDKCNFYNNILFDTSQFDGIYDGEDCSTYQKVRTEPISYLAEN